MWYLPKFFGSLPLLFLCLDLRFHGTVGMMNSQVYSSLPALLIVAWTTMLGDVKGNGDVDKHLEMGNKMLAAGQLADALSHYHAAIELDPTNYKLFYRRATVYLAMGKSKSALPDLDTVIQLKPDFTSARLQRGSVKLKQGKLDEARTDFEQVILKDKGNTEAQEKLNLIGPLQESIQDAEDFFRDGEYHEAIGILTSAIETCPWDIHLRELRASCYEAVGDYFKAVHDIRPTTKLRSDNTAGHYRISKLYYEMGEAEESLNEIRECLKLDPDHKECHPHYKKVKKLVKQLQSILDFRNEQRWEDCLGKVAQAQKTEPDVRAYVRRATEHNCHCHSKAGHHKEAMEACDTVLSYDEKNIEALCDKAEALILNEEFEEAVNLYKKAEETAGELRRVQDGLKRAQKLLKQSLKRDYYKILGVKRNADKKEIMKAYRKLAVQWHPDKYDGDDKAKAEKMFYDIAAAKEVLSDPEMRAKFDNGEDPLDPEEQAHHGHGGHPFFHQGFNPFGGGGGFNFKFNYN